VRGFGAFLGKELRETVHTWRIWVLPAFILFAALSSPLITFLTPTLVDRLGGMQQGLVISVSEPTALAAYVEYLGNLGELVLFALVIAYGGIVSSEVRSGTAALALAKPLSRGAFVLAKWLSQLLVIAIAAAAATGVCIALTTVLLGVGPAAEAAAAVALWLVYAVVILSAMVLLSAVLPAPAAAAGAGIGIYASFAVLAQFEVTSRLTPAGLMAAAQAILSGGSAPWQMPVATGMALSAACLAAAVWRFSRREI
jgi:ABC-type transport system involved in multi-copper enzyme maturation permease subunit